MWFGSRGNIVVRFIIRLAFWGCLLVANLPGARKSGVYNEDLGIETIGLAVQATFMDLANFCSRNGTVCETSAQAFSEASATAKESLLSAYQGIRGQYDDVDRQTTTSSIKATETKAP